MANERSDRMGDNLLRRNNLIQYFQHVGTFFEETAKHAEDIRKACAGFETAYKDIQKIIAIEEVRIKASQLQAQHQGEPEGFSPKSM